MSMTRITDGTNCTPSPRCSQSNDFSSTPSPSLLGRVACVNTETNLGAPSSVFEGGAFDLSSIIFLVGNPILSNTQRLNVLPLHSNANKKVIDTQCTSVLFSRVFVYTEPRSATRKSRPVYPEPRRALLAPLLFITLSSHSSLFFSEVCSLFFLTAVSQPFVCQSLRYSFHRDGWSHPSSQELCAIFASCPSPLPILKSRRPLALRAPKSRRINTCKSLSKQRTLTLFRMIDLQKTGGRGGVMVNQL